MTVGQLEHPAECCCKPWRGRLRSAKLASLWLIILVAFFWQPVGAGQTATEEPRFRSTSRLVVLDVVVTDTHGQPVRGLTTGDFTILENGVQQNVASFEAPVQHPGSPAATTARAGSHANETSNVARNILVLDELNNAVLDEAYGRQSIEKYLRKHGPILNQPTSLIIVGQERMELAHDYTRNTAVLLEALKEHHAELPFAQMRGGAYWASERLAKTLWVLEQIAAANLHFAGRKNVIWIGAGFPELTWRNLAAEDRHKFAATIGGIANELFEARLAVYTLNPQGLAVAATSYDGTFGDATTGELVFESLAPETGGKIFRLQNALDELIAASMEDGAAYYTLSYYPSNHIWDGQFRNIKLLLSGKGLEARVRKGYYAVAQSPLSDDQVDNRLSDAVMSPIPYRALNVHALVTPAAPGSGKYVLRIDRDALYWQTLESGKRRCEVTVVTATTGSDPQFSTHNVRQLEAVLDAQQYLKPSDKPVVFNFVAELPKDTRLVKVVVRDSTNGNIGTAEITREALKGH